MTHQDQEQPGPYVLMRTDLPARFWGSINGQDAWIPFASDCIHVCLPEDVATAELSEEEIFVEIADRAPGFLSNEKVQGKSALLEKDYLRFAPFHNEIFDVFDEYARLIGIHVNRNDFYFRLVTEDGEKLYSMACAIRPLRGRVDARYYEAIDRNLSVTDAVPCETFMVTRELDKPWPRKLAPAAICHSFGPDDRAIFGPFASVEELEEFKVRAKALKGYTHTTHWKDDLTQSLEFSGTTITPAMQAKVDGFRDTDDPLDVLLSSIIF